MNDETWVRDVTDRLATWADGPGGADRDVDVDGAELLLDLAREELGLTGPDGLTPETLRALLLEVFPETVVAEAGEVPSILAALRALVAFLDGTGALPGGRAAALVAELEAVTPAFTRVVEDADTDERRAAAEVIAGMMAEDGVDTGDVAAVERWVAAFEALPESERFTRTEDYLRRAEELVVPPVRLASVDELARAARASGLLPSADSADSGDSGDSGGGDDDAAVLEAWLTRFDEVAVAEPSGDEEVEVAELVRGELTGVLIQLYEQREPSAPDDLTRVLLDHVEAVYEVGDPRLLARAVAEALREQLGEFAAWGVVAEAGGGLELTPLGVWGVRELLLADGYLAPVVGALAAASAAELVAGLVLHRPDTLDDEITAWLDGRDRPGAARDLIAIMRDGRPGERVLAAAVLDRLGAEAEPQVRDAVDDPTVRPYAARWLTGHGLPAPEPDPDWLFVDGVAGRLETAAPVEAVTALPVPDDVAALWRCHHPATAEVLGALGDHHPDRGTAKSARTAAFKARSAAGGS
ncbi:hypothetical protein [Actinomadura harenae]|uniref:Uncharacterized protein n=1 Tax=Actinomadura harenae TaxID=2483351 RepID=A0A3M2LP58_9ACTN|nr:hypothetical protein [Actinomadura harenae]RMI38670.1 hypothetical protein EBO15_32095 [Actinomadura harenae]